MSELKTIMLDKPLTLFSYRGIYRVTQLRIRSIFWNNCFINSYKSSRSYGLCTKTLSYTILHTYICHSVMSHGVSAILICHNDKSNRRIACLGCFSQIHNIFSDVCYLGNELSVATFFLKLRVNTICCFTVIP